ncbi:hypothetical protein MRX96_042556 [Rhipicephalus microplus]
MAAVKANFAALAKLVADVLVSDDDDGEMSEEELEETSDLTVAAVLVAQIMREDRHRVRLYVESVVDSYSDEEFRRLFRLQRHADVLEDSDISNSNLGIFSSEPVDVGHKPTLAAKLRDRLAQSVPL